MMGETSAISVPKRWFMASSPAAVTMKTAAAHRKLRSEGGRLVALIQLHQTGGC